MMNGPHCPKCGISNQWATYSTDAIRCESSVSPGDGTVGQCGYIHWLRNAPPEEVNEATRLRVRARAERQAQLDLLHRRKRIRKLVHAMIRSGLTYDKFDVEWLVAYDRFINLGATDELQKEMQRIRAKSIVQVACELDEQIEAVTITQGRES